MRALLANESFAFVFHWVRNCLFATALNNFEALALAYRPRLDDFDPAAHHRRIALIVDEILLGAALVFLIFWMLYVTLHGNRAGVLHLRSHHASLEYASVS